MTSAPIAVIGMACRFAGGVDTPEKLWTLCAEGRSGVSKLKPHHWRFLYPKSTLVSDRLWKFRIKGEHATLLTWEP